MVVQKTWQVIQGLLEREQQQANFIAGPEPVNPFAKAVQAAGRRACENYGNAPNWLKQLPVPTARTTGRICGPYLESQGWSQPELAPPFSGAQCNVLYNFTLTASGTALNLNTNQSFPVDYGPFNGQIAGPVSAVNTEIVDRPINSQQANVTVVGNNDAAGYQLGLQNDRRFISITPSVVFSRADGQADNCGSPAPTYRPGPNPPPNTPLPPGREPIPDPRQPEFPIFPLPDVYIDIGIEVPILPDPVGASEPDPSGAPPVGSGSPISGDDLAANDGDFPDPPPGTEWVGAILEITDYPAGFGNVSGPLPNRVFPAVIGNFRLKLQSENGTTFLSENSQVREDMQSLFRRNEGIRVRGAVVNVVQNVAYEVTPLYAEVVSDT